jgi:hypothetical protein
LSPYVPAEQRGLVVVVVVVVVVVIHSKHYYRDVFQDAVYKNVCQLSSAGVAQTVEGLGYWLGDQTSVTGSFVYVSAG